MYIGYLIYIKSNKGLQLYLKRRLDVSNNIHFIIRDEHCCLKLWNMIAFTEIHSFIDDELNVALEMLFS